MPTDLPLPTVGVPATGPAHGDVTALAGPPIVLRVAGRAYAVHALTASLACCAVEARAAQVLAETAALAGVTGDGALEQVLVVAGTVTHAMAPAVERLWDGLPQPRRAIAFGACATSGGPYWDSYSVAQGIGDRVPVDLYVPGCPPRPEALLAALARLADLPEAS